MIEDERNKTFIEDFKSFLKDKYFTTAKKQGKSESSTVRGTMQHLFTSETSFLAFETKRDKEFKLDRLVDFNSSQLIQLEEPNKWLLSTGGPSGQENPNTR